MTTWLDLFTWNLNLLTSPFNTFISMGRTSEYKTLKIKKARVSICWTFYLPPWLLSLSLLNADKRWIDSSVDLLPVWPINHSVKQTFYWFLRQAWTCQWKNNVCRGTHEVHGHQSLSHEHTYKHTSTLNYLSICSVHYICVSPRFELWKSSGIVKFILHNSNANLAEWLRSLH